MKVETRSGRRPSPAFVLAALALFVAIGGTAAALPGSNTVNSGDIKNGQVKTQDVANDTTASALTGTDVAAESLTGADVLNGSLGAGELAGGIGGGLITNGSIAAADLGASAVGSGRVAAITEAVDPTPFDFGDQDEGNNDYVYGSSTADCPAGTTLIAGGAEFLGAATGGGGGDELQAIHESRRSGNSWVAIAVSDVDNQDFRAFAYCLTAGT